MLLALMIAFGLYVDSERWIDRAHKQRHDSFRLAEQLRQSSDNLTRMARMYVTTGDPRYRGYYQEILDVRDGRKPRPKDYFLGYWEHRLVAPGEQQGDGEPAIAMIDLMRRAGASDDELGKLAESKRKSDELAVVEFEAMKLSENAGQKGWEGRSAALHLLHDEHYHQAKVAIMKPIKEFYHQMDLRTAAQIRAAEDTASNFRIAFMLAFLGACLLLWRMPNRLLALFAVGLVPLACWIGYSFGGLAVGADTATTHLGFIRALLPYCIGVLLWRWWRDQPTFRINPVWALAAMPLLVLAIPAGLTVPWAYDLAFALLVCPLLMAGGLAYTGSNAMLRWIGGISFPIYAINLPLLLWSKALGLGMVTGLALSLALAAWLAMRSTSRPPRAGPQLSHAQGA